MKKPTVEELTKLINDYHWTLDSPKMLANEIHALYNPPLKPLEELHKDEKACREIAEMFSITFEKAELVGDDVVKITGNSGLEKISIWYDGEVFFELTGGIGTPLANPFRIADKIRELGYEPQP